MRLCFFSVVLCWLHCYYVCSQSPIVPGYLDFDNLPETNFSCQKKVIGGYYADVETGCQMFHVCTIGQKGEVTDIKFLCLNGTVFDQETRVCERVDEVDCSQAEEFFDLNLELYGSNIPFGFPSEDEASDGQSSGSEHESKKEGSTTTSTTSTTTTTTTTTTPIPTFPATTRKPSTPLPSLHFLSVTTQRPPSYPPNKLFPQQNGASTQRNNQNYQTVSTTLPSIPYSSPRFPLNKQEKPGHLGHYPLSSPPGVATLLAISNNFNNGGGNNHDEDGGPEEDGQFEDDLDDYESSGGGDFEEEEEEEIVIQRPGPHANRFPVTTIGNENVRIENNGAVDKDQPVNGHSAFTESLIPRNRQSIPHGNQGYIYRKNQQDPSGQHKLTTDYILNQQRENDKLQLHGGFNSNNQFSFSTTTPTSSHFYHQQNGAVFSSTLQPFLVPSLLKSDTHDSEYESQKIGRQVQSGTSLLKRKLEEEVHHESAAHSHHNPVKFQVNRPDNPLFTTPAVAVVSQTSSTSFVSSVSKVINPTTPSNGTILGISTITSVGTPQHQHNPHNLTIDPSAFQENLAETTPPSSYDEYLEGDVQKDPFYHDVPRLASKKRSKRAATSQKQHYLAPESRSLDGHQNSQRAKLPSETNSDLATMKKTKNKLKKYKKAYKKSKPIKSYHKKYTKYRTFSSPKKNFKHRSNGKGISKSRKSRETRDIFNSQKRRVSPEDSNLRVSDIKFQTGEHVSVSSSPSHYVSRENVGRKFSNLRSLVNVQNRQRIPQPAKSLITEAIFEPRHPADDPVEAFKSVTAPQEDLREYPPKTETQTARAQIPQTPKESQRTSIRTKPALVSATNPNLMTNERNIATSRRNHHSQRPVSKQSEEEHGQSPVDVPLRSSGRGGISLEAFGPSVSRRNRNKTPPSPEGRPRIANTPASTFLANYPVEMVEQKTKSHMVAVVPTHNRVSQEFLKSLEIQQGIVETSEAPVIQRNTAGDSRRNLASHARRQGAVVPTQSSGVETQRRGPSTLNTHRESRHRGREPLPTNQVSERKQGSHIRSRQRAIAALPVTTSSESTTLQVVTDPSQFLSAVTYTNIDQIKNVNTFEPALTVETVVPNVPNVQIQNQTPENISSLDVPLAVITTKAPRTSRRQRVREPAQGNTVISGAQILPTRHSSRNTYRGSETRQSAANVPIASRVAPSEAFHSRRTSKTPTPPPSYDTSYDSVTSQASPVTLPRSRVSSRNSNRSHSRASLPADPEVTQRSSSRRTAQPRLGSVSGPSEPAHSQQVSESQLDTTAPTQAPLPVTSFTCADKIPGGYYADLEADCQLFHICSQGRHGRIKDNKFLCGPGTRFNQQSRTCQAREMVDCELSASLYHLNNHFTVPVEDESLPVLPAMDFEPHRIHRTRPKRSSVEAIHTADDRSDRRRRRQTGTVYYDDYDFEDSSYETQQDPTQTPERSPKGVSSYDEYLYVDYVDPTTTKKPKSSIDHMDIRTLEATPTTTRTKETTLNADYYLSHDYLNDNYEPQTYKANSTDNKQPHLDVFVTIQKPGNDSDLASEEDSSEEITTVSVTPPAKSTTPSQDEDYYYYYDEDEPTGKDANSRELNDLYNKTIPGKTDKGKITEVTSTLRTKDKLVTQRTKDVLTTTKKAKIELVTSTQTPEKDVQVSTLKAKTNLVTSTEKSKEMLTNTPKSKNELVRGPHKTKDIVTTTLKTTIESIKTTPKTKEVITNTPETEMEDVAVISTPAYESKTDDIADSALDETSENSNDNEQSDKEIETIGKVDVNKIFFTTAIPKDSESIEDISNETDTEVLSTMTPLQEVTGKPLDPIRQAVLKVLGDDVIFDDKEVTELPAVVVEETTLVTTLSPKKTLTTTGSAEVLPTTDVPVDTTTIDDDKLVSTTTELKTTAESTTPTTTTTMTVKSRRKFNRNRHTSTTDAPFSTTYPSTIQSLFKRTRARPTPKYHHAEVALPTVHIKPITSPVTRRPQPSRSRLHFDRLREKNKGSTTTEDSNDVGDSDVAKSSVHPTRIARPSSETNTLDTTSDSEEAFSTLVPLSITPAPKLEVTSKTSVRDLKGSKPTKTPLKSSSEASSENLTSPMTETTTVAALDSSGADLRHDEPSLKILQSFARMQDETFYPEGETTVMPDHGHSEPPRRFEGPEVVLVKAAGRGFSQDPAPITRPGFSCTDKAMFRYYPDLEDSRIFHYCSPGFHDRQKLDFLFICDRSTTFNSQLQKCE